MGIEFLKSFQEIKRKYYLQITIIGVELQLDVEVVMIMKDIKDLVLLVDQTLIQLITTKIEFNYNPNYDTISLEAIQVEYGDIFPDCNYLKQARAYAMNILFRLYQLRKNRKNENARPDVLLLGKTLLRGSYPISAVLAIDKFKLQIKPVELGTSYGDNPLAASLCINLSKNYVGLWEKDYLDQKNMEKLLENQQNKDLFKPTQKTRMTYQLHLQQLMKKNLIMLSIKLQNLLQQM